MTLTFATGNKGKYLEVKHLFNAKGIDLEQAPIDLYEMHLDSVEEIAKFKCIQAYQILEKPVVVDDTGIFFENFTGFPGVRSKWVFDQIGYEGLFNLLKGKGRKAFFRCACAFTRDGKTVSTFTGELKGSIATEVTNPKADSKGLSYNKIFVPAGENRTLIQMTLDEINAIDHRSKAFDLLADYLARNPITSTS